MISYNEYYFILNMFSLFSDYSYTDDYHYGATEVNLTFYNSPLYHAFDCKLDLTKSVQEVCEDLLLAFDTRNEEK